MFKYTVYYSYIGRGRLGQRLVRVKAWSKRGAIAKAFKPVPRGVFFDRVSRGWKK